MKFGVPELEDLGDVAGRSVLVRADFNVPLSGGEITDDLRIRAALPTLNWLTEHGASVTACSHLGRPKGSPIRSTRWIRFVHACPSSLRACTLLDNLRFDAGETANDPAFVEKLDRRSRPVRQRRVRCFAPGACVDRRAPARLPSAAGRLLASRSRCCWVSARTRRPFVAITGGAKVSDKLGVIDALLEIADSIIIGGGMCFTFFAAMGNSIGDSLCEPDQIDACARLLDEHGDRLHLPSDVVGLGPGGKIGDPSAGGEVRNFGRGVPDGWMGLDIGPGSAAEFGDVIGEARTILWNGPMGVFEDPRFEAGTRAVAEAVAESRAFSVIGGGDSAAAVTQFGLADQVSHISTGGGASLELIEQGDLPGLDALRGAPNA